MKSYSLDRILMFSVALLCGSCNDSRDCTAVHEVTEHASLFSDVQGFVRGAPSGMIDSYLRSEEKEDWILRITQGEHRIPAQSLVDDVASRCSYVEVDCFTRKVLVVGWVRRMSAGSEEEARQTFREISAALNKEFSIVPEFSVSVDGERCIEFGLWQGHVNNSRIHLRLDVLREAEGWVIECQATRMGS